MAPSHYRRTYVGVALLVYIQSNTGSPYWFSVPSTITRQSTAIVDSIQQEERVEREKAQWKSISGWYYQLCTEVAEKTGV